MNTFIIHIVTARYSLYFIVRHAIINVYDFNNIGPFKIQVSCAFCIRKYFTQRLHSTISYLHSVRFSFLTKLNENRNRKDYFITLNITCFRFFFFIVSRDQITNKLLFSPKLFFIVLIIEELTIISQMD